MDDKQFRALTERLDGIAKQLEDVVGILNCIEGNTGETESNTKHLRQRN